MEELGHQTFWWAAVDGEGVTTGVLPLVRVTSRLFGDYLVSMPFVSYGGPVGDDRSCRVLADVAAQEARRLGTDLLELRCRSRFETDLTVSTRKVTVLKELPASPEELWEEGLRAKVRSQVRRPMKAGFQARFGTQLVDPFYEVYSRTMRDLGTPVLPRTFFSSIAAVFPDELIFGIVEIGGVPAAAGCGFLWKGEFEITWAGALREFNREAPNMLLYWSLMEETIRRGGDTFNFGRCTPDSGTHRFKRQWGSTDHTLPWLQWSPTGVVSPPNPDDRKFRLAVAAWRRLPVGVANLIGPRLSPWLP
jgi:FemAB-related protein (PEP-CTERM system-associated)